MSKTKEKKPVSPAKALFDKFIFAFYVLALVAAVCFSSFVWFQKTYFVSYWVNGQSMWPTLNSETRTAKGVLFNDLSMSMDGATGVDFVIGDTHKNVMDKLGRFDIVVCKYAEDDFFDKIKRVIVLPGETFYIDSTGKNKEHNGDLYILNDDTGVFELVVQPLSHEYIEVGEYPLRFTTPTTLAENEYFVMGDNRAHSSDSRQNGPVKKDNIEAKAIALVARCKTIIPQGSPSLVPTEINYMWPRFF